MKRLPTALLARQLNQRSTTFRPDLLDRFAELHRFYRKFDQTSFKHQDRRQWQAS